MLCNCSGSTPALKAGRTVRIREVKANRSGSVAQLGERTTFNREDAGSKPGWTHRRNGAKEACDAHNVDIGRRNPGTCYQSLRNSAARVSARQAESRGFESHRGDGTARRAAQGSLPWSLRR